MARKRMIDPSIWADEDFASLSYEAMVMFIGMISNADDEGRLPGNPLFLASSILPFKGIDLITAKQIRSEVLTKMKSLIMYVVDGKEYLEFKKWKQYQAINRPTASKYPSSEPKNDTHGGLMEDSLNPHGGLTPNRIEKNRKESQKPSIFSLEENAEIQVQAVPNMTPELRKTLFDFAEAGGKNGR
jgi:hypothetical protein